MTGDPGRSTPVAGAERPGPGIRRDTVLTVVIPAYNAERFVAEAICSVLDQNHGDIEIIVVDDGSTDGTSRIVDELAVRHESVSVIRQENSGVCAARNAGLDCASGAITLFLDADDLLLPGAANELVMALEAGGRFMALGVPIRITEDGLVPSPQPVPAKMDDSPAGWTLANQGRSGSGVAVLTDAARSVGGFDERLRLAEGEVCADWQFYLRVRMLGPSAYLASPTIAYRKVRGSMSGDPVELLLAVRALIWRIEHEMDNFYPRVDSSVVALHACYLLAHELRHGSARRFLQILRVLNPDERSPALRSIFTSKWSSLHWYKLVRRTRDRVIPRPGSETRMYPMQLGRYLDLVNTGVDVANSG